MKATPETYLGVVDSIVKDVVAPSAIETDRSGAFPRAALDKLGAAGLLGLISAKEVGGLGLGHEAATWTVERIGRECASTGMIVCMHYCAAAVIEVHGSQDTRKAVAAGHHLSTLAFSEAGSRSHFWAPLGTAKAPQANGHVQLDARKSWATSAGQVDSYVWSSRPMAGEGASTIWLVPGKASGLSVPGAFDGLGLRGNASSPVAADKVMVDKGAMLGPDGAGFDIMMGIVLPYFQLMTAACNLGIMESATAKAAAHVGSTKLEHLGSALSDLPTVRAYIARMRLKTDSVRALIGDTLIALANGRPDASLRVLEVKAAAAEAAIEVTELAMRVCGGAAFRREVGVERSFRDARAASVMAPTTDVLYDFIGKAAIGLPLF